MTGGRRGWCSAALCCALAGALSCWLAASAFAAPARRADAFVDSIGVNTHTYYGTPAYSDYAGWRDKLLGSGIRYIRENLQRSSSRQVSRINDLYAAGGIRASFIFDPRTDRGGTVPDLFNRMKSSMLAATAQAEGPNEYENAHRSDWSTVADAARAYQAQLHKTINADPATRHLTVLGPSVAYPSGYQAWGDLSGSLDAGNMHSYSGGRMPSASLAEWMTAAATTSATKPVQATETGYHNAIGSLSGHLPASERAAGIYLPRLYLEYFRRGVRRTFAYELLSEGTDTLDIEDNFGLLRNDYSDKPAMTALRNLIALLEDPGPTFTAGTLNYTLTTAPGDVRRVLLQKRDGSFWLALWREVSVWDRINRVELYPRSASVTLSLDQPMATVRTYLPNVSEAPTGSWTGRTNVTLDIGPQVTLVEFVPTSASPTTSSSGESSLDAARRRTGCRGSSKRRSRRGTRAQRMRASRAGTQRGQAGRKRAHRRASKRSACARRLRRAGRD